MLSFIEFLQEKINFAKGRDNDFFYHNYAIITLVKGDINKYKVEGKTAGLWSHACKHLYELDPNYVENIVQQVKNTLIKYVEDDKHPRNYEFKMFSRDKKELSGDPKKLISKAPRASIINFLDLVNDKIMLKKELAPIESKMKKYLESLGDKYGTYIEEIIDKSVDVDQIEREEDKVTALTKERYVSFTVRNTETSIFNKLFFDTKNHIVVIKTNQFVNTCYRVSNSGSTVESFFKTVYDRVMRNAGFQKVSTYRAFSTAFNIS